MEKSGLFSKLNEEQIEMISQYGEFREAKKGENLIKVGERNHNFFVVLKGAVAILGSNNEALAIHKTGEFTGNSDSLSERTAVFSAVAHSDAVVLDISQEKLKEIISKNQELSEILLENLEKFEGRGIYYGAAHMEAQTISGKK